ncbi:restriction endonuclease subunit M [Alicyclobacillus hesperidum]|uniref:DNA (cytosine-5-)-methyltransferase n=1 Tax=Alicyclobacillus hesperidum TaxID=89784 RepID=A0AA37X4G5_9BACL|nr:DNA cytosine methyltransferase [Alicyclobacillus hesperidum]GLV14992.1 restriction endonuclease subunit M [Alicyclobacillus hesperidum]
MSEPSIFSFFAGAGFLDLGFEMNGYHMAYVNELHAPFLKTYQHSRQVLGVPEPEFGCHQEDIANLLDEPHRSELSVLVQEAKDRYGLVGFIGGPPCPDFSVGGKNRGRTGDNGKLTATYVELICQQRPSFFLFENVKGLWKTAKHRVFYEEMKQKLHANGYVTTERLINSLEYGVPQYRERIILVGFQKDVLKDLGYQVDSSILPEELFPWMNHIKYPVSDVFNYPWPTTDSFGEDILRPCPTGIPRELTVEHWFRKNDVEHHPNAAQYFQPRAGLAKFTVIDEGDDSKKSYKRLHRWRYSPTAAYGNNEVHLHPYKARRISVAEALAIQSLPKEYTLPQDMTLTDAFKTVGNGVPFLAASGIARTILDFLGVSTCNVLQHRTSFQPSMDYRKTVSITI